ncbi:MAG: DUF11 domain-containing protein, partial [Sphingorhabdus sp.]|nr:DUF11 domain-containing protein [Sphingorhabdus sp.]
PKAIPGAMVRYCITINNAGSAAATNMIATDAIPSNLTYDPGSIQSGAACGSAATAEDDDAADSTEIDGITASISGSTVTIRRASFLATQSFAVTFTATIN